MSTFKVEKGIPIPPPRKNPGGSKYNFITSLEVGDSFTVPLSPATAHSVISKYSKRFGVKMTVRKESSGCRVWRVA